MAIEAGLVSPAHLVVDTFPSEQGSPRVNRGYLDLSLPGLGRLRKQGLTTLTL
jgi:hypothetical protein